MFPHLSRKVCDCKLRGDRMELHWIVVVGCATRRSWSERGAGCGKYRHTVYVSRCTNKS
jgi:hypothetical protein